MILTLNITLTCFGVLSATYALLSVKKTKTKHNLKKFRMKFRTVESFFLGGGGQKSPGVRQSSKAQLVSTGG